MIPVFFVFPIAFTLNRLGQHYDIDPDDPAKWGTLMRGSWFWDFAFLNSNYHLEHHYFPGVPFYHLPALQRALKPFYVERRACSGRPTAGCCTAGSCRTRCRTPTGHCPASAGKLEVRSQKFEVKNEAVCDYSYRKLFRKAV